MTTPTADYVLLPEQLPAILGIPFTAEQLAAITSPRSASVVIAGAGSGKTAVMSARVVWLVGSAALPPEQVLGLTFTNKAAAELSQRVRLALERLAASGYDVAEGEPTISTYHAYAASLLREYGLRAGLEPGAQLMVDATSFQLAERVVRRSDGPFQHLRLKLRAMTEAVVALDAEMNEHLVSPEAVRAHDARLLVELSAVERERGRLTARPREAKEAALARTELLELVVAFRREKVRCDVVDFGDQMAGAAVLAADFPDIGTSERERFSAVLLDEYQDTSIAQKRLLLALFGEGYPVTAVGDPFQAIYGWRGASVRNITEFAHEFSDSHLAAPVHALSQNNRSAANILELANAVAAPLRAVHPQVAQLQPRPDLPATGEISLALYASQVDEITALCDDISKRVRQGERPSSIAVLCRETKTFPDIYQALTTRGVPVEVVGLGGLLELPEIVELVSMLLVVDDPTANPAMLRLLAGARWRIGPRDLALLGARARQLVATAEQRPTEYSVAAALADAVSGIDPAEVVSLSEAVHDPGQAPFSAEARQRFAAIDVELTELRRHSAEPLPEFVQRVIDQIGLEIELDVRAAGDLQTGRSNRADNVATFCRYVGEFVDLDGRATLGAFLAFLAASDRYRTGLDRGISTSADSVKVMTIHQAKGLEWPTVYVPQLSQTVFPSSQGRSLWISSAQVLPYSLRGDAADFPTVNDWTGNKDCNAFREDMKQHDLLEERRLAYVALTRAEHRLVLSGHWWGPTQQKPRGPSQYLEEVHTFCTDRLPEAKVIHWEPEPADGAVNPALIDHEPVAWPVEFATPAAVNREAGAELVRAALVESPLFIDVPLPADTNAVVRSWDDDLQALIAEAQAASHASRDVLLPSALSASQVVRLANDPQGLARDLARPMPRPAARAARRGTRFHTWVESRFGQTPLIDLDDLDDASADAGSTELAELQAVFLAGPFADRAPAAIEAPFQLVLGGRSIRGRIDAVYVADASAGEEVRYEVVDWKTGRSHADPLQLSIYRLAWAELHDLPLESVSAAFYYVSTGVVERPSPLLDRTGLTAVINGDGA